MMRRRIGIFTVVMVILDILFVKYVLLPWSTNWFRMLVTIFFCLHQGYSWLMANIGASLEDDCDEWYKSYLAMKARWAEEEKREQEAQHDN